MVTAAHKPFDAAVFSGGGCRCFWQAGFWSEAAPRLGLRPRAIGAVSAGAAFACAAVSGAVDHVVRDFVRRTAANPRNFYPTNWTRGRSAFPHEQMYRGTILEAFDETALRRVQSGPEIRVLLTRPPRLPFLTPTLLMGLAAYGVERLWRQDVHPTLARRVGFRPAVVLAQSCSTPAELADLILHSSCMPPLTPVFRRQGQVVIDGALVDAAPADLVDECQHALVLLTRRYPQLPRHPGRHYVQPSERVPIAMWDYASPRLVQRTFDLGRRDGEAFARRRGVQ